MRWTTSWSSSSIGKVVITRACVSREAEVVELVRVLARRMRDEAIASILNRSGKLTGRGNSWTSARVASLRNHQKIAPYREGERAERGEITIEEAAAELAVSPSTIFRMINGVAGPASLQRCAMD